MRASYLSVLLPLLTPALCAQGGFGVILEQKISATSGGLGGGTLADQDRFGQGLANLGDLDGDGFFEIAVGVSGSDDGGTDRGAVLILSLNPDGTVRSEAKISSTTGGFTGALSDGDIFGNELVCLGDINGDGKVELAVAATLDDDGGGLNADRGSIWILSLNSDGTVSSHQKISSTQGNFMGTIGDFDTFGQGLAKLPDLDGDGVPELAVGVPLSDIGGMDRGAIFIVFLNAAGTVKSEQEISSVNGGFGGTLDNSDFFGRSLAWLGDLNGDGFGELAVGVQQDDDGGTDRGAVYILTLNNDGTVRSETKISDTLGGFNGTLDDGAAFGISVAWLGDQNGDGIGELVVAANRLDRSGISDQGGFWLLSIDSSLTVQAEQEISSAVGGFGGTLDTNDRLGTEVLFLPDLQGGGAIELAAGAINDDDGGSNRGALHMLTITRTATATFRNAGSNPASLSAPPPVLGQTYVATVDLSTTGHAMASLTGYLTPPGFTFTLPGGQTVLQNLLNPSGELLMLPLQPGPLATFSMFLPLNVDFAGVSLTLQSGHLGGVVPFALSNAFDVTLGAQ